MKYKIGDIVLCVKESDLPNYIGATWEVIYVTETLFYCKNDNLYPVNRRGKRSAVNPAEGFPFREDEIVLVSSLIKELV
jgi:hypothetical protein